MALEAGLVDGSDVTSSGSTDPSAMITRLTWQGHEFLDASRDETRWKKAMDIVKEKVGSIPIDLLKDLLKSLMKASLGLP